MNMSDAILLRCRIRKISTEVAALNKDKGLLIAELRGLCDHPKVIGHRPTNGTDLAIATCVVCGLARGSVDRGLEELEGKPTYLAKDRDEYHRLTQEDRLLDDFGDFIFEIR